MSPATCNTLNYYPGFSWTLHQFDSKLLMNNMLLLVLLCQDLHDSIYGLLRDGKINSLFVLLNGCRIGAGAPLSYYQLSVCWSVPFLLSWQLEIFVVLWSSSATTVTGLASVNKINEDGNTMDTVSTVSTIGRRLEDSIC